MEFSRKKQIIAAWKRIEPHFQPLQVVASDGDDGETSVTLIQAALRPFFMTLWGMPNSQFEIPPDYRYFLSIASAGWRCDKGLGFYFYPPQIVIYNTKAGYELSDDDEIPPEQNTWIELGHWSDKHDVFLCCDPLDPHFGTVVDCHDGHPWFSAEVCSPVAPDFLSYLLHLNF